MDKSGRAAGYVDNPSCYRPRFVCYCRCVGRWVQRFWDEFGRPRVREAVPGDPRRGVFNAFVPHPITGWSPLLDARTWQATRRAEDAAAEVCTHGADGEGGARWMAVRLESSASSQIEDIHVPARRLARGEARPERIAATDWAVGAVIGNIAATEHALTLGSTAATVTVDDICSIHRALMGDDPIAGRVRTEQNWIGTRYSTPPNAVFVPPPPQLVPELLEDLVASINESDWPAVVHAAVVHAQFEAIHPFDDGNGRTGRALMLLMLARSGLTKSSVLPISATLAQRRAPHVQTLDYLHVLNAAHRVCDAGSVERSEALNGWITLLADAVTNAATHLSMLTGEVAEIRQNWRRVLKRRRTADSNTAMDLINVLPEHPIVSVNDAADLLGANSRTARRSIQRLDDVGILTQTNDGKRNRLYEATDITNTLAEFAFINPGGGIERRRHRTPIPAGEPTGHEVTLSRRSFETEGPSGVAPA